MKESDCVLLASIDKELCPLNLAPTASTTVALAIGDALVIEWMRINQLSIWFCSKSSCWNSWKKISLRVSRSYDSFREIKSLDSKDNIKDIIFEITKNGIGICLVKNNSDSRNIPGLITDGDLRRSLKKTARANGINYQQMILWLLIQLELAPIN